MKGFVISVLRYFDAGFIDQFGMQSSITEFGNF